jgi:hypothetical protein
MAITLNKHLFLASAAASAATAWYPVDYKDSEIQERSIQGVKGATSGDVLNVELRTDVTAPDGVTYQVITTATAFTGAVTNFSCVIRGPFEYIRVRKEGASAFATVIGIV